MQSDDRTLLTFLGQAYRYKQISDYDVGQKIEITEAEAHEAIVDADTFVTRIAGWISGE